MFLQSLARLAARGLQPDATVLFGSDRRFRPPAQATPGSTAATGSSRPPPRSCGAGDSSTRSSSARRSWSRRTAWPSGRPRSASQKFPYLRDHQVDGEIVFPATGHLELAWAVAGEQFRHESFFLENLHFDSPLILPDNSRHPPDVRLEIVSGRRGLPHLQPARGRSQRTCRGRSTRRAASTRRTTASRSRPRRSPISASGSSTATSSPSRRSTRRAGGRAWTTETSSAACSNCGIAATRCWPAWSCAASCCTKSQRYAVHPALLDACLHVVFADVHRHGDPGRAFLPYRIDRVRFHRPARPERLVARPGHAQRRAIPVLGHADLRRRRRAGRRGARPDLQTTGRRRCAPGRRACTRAATNTAGRSALATRPCTGGSSTAPRAVLIADAGGEELASELAARLSGGRHPAAVDSPRPARLVRRTAGGRAAGSTDHDRFPRRAGGGSPAGKGLAACPYVPSLLQLAQTLHKREGVPRLFVVTSGAAGVPGDRDLDLGQAMLHGMARVINNECANVPLTVIDLSEPPLPVEVEALYRRAAAQPPRSGRSGDRPARRRSGSCGNWSPWIASPPSRRPAPRRPGSAAITGPT